MFCIKDSFRTSQRNQRLRDEHQSVNIVQGNNGCLRSTSRHNVERTWSLYFWTWRHRY